MASFRGCSAGSWGALPKAVVWAPYTAQPVLTVEMCSGVQDSTQDKTGGIKVLKWSQQCCLQEAASGAVVCWGRERWQAPQSGWLLLCCLILTGSLPELHDFLLGCRVMCMVGITSASCGWFTPSKEGGRALFPSQAQFQILCACAQQGHLEWCKLALDWH